MTSAGFAGGMARENHARTAAANPPGAAAGGLARALGEPLIAALRFAAMAPSAHNAQPWRVLVHDRQRWSLALAHDRRLPATDPGDRGAVLALGAFLENLCLAGAALGYRVDPERLGARVDDPELVGLRITPCRPAGSTEPIVARRTARRAFARRVVPQDTLARLCAGMDSLAWIPAGTPTAERLRELVAGATAAQLARREAITELGGWLRRYTPAASAGTGDGLTPAELELPGVTAWLVRAYSADRLLASQLFRRGLVARTARLAQACGGWLVLTSPDGSMPALVEAGRQLERLYLRARPLGLGLHPMSQPLQEAGWRQDLERSTGVDGFPRMLLRVGFSGAWPQRPGLRLAPETFARLVC